MTFLSMLGSLRTLARAWSSCTSSETVLNFSEMAMTALDEPSSGEGCSAALSIPRGVTKTKQATTRVSKAESQVREQIVWTRVSLGEMTPADSEGLASITNRGSRLARVVRPGRSRVGGAPCLRRSLAKTSPGLVASCWLPPPGNPCNLCRAPFVRTSSLHLRPRRLHVLFIAVVLGSQRAPNVLTNDSCTLLEILTGRDDSLG